MFSCLFGESDVLYVLFANDECYEYKHKIIPVNIRIRLKGDKILFVEGQYCLNCNQIQVRRNKWAANRDYHDDVIGKVILKGLDDIFSSNSESDLDEYDYPKRSQESKLKKYGYSVSWDNPLTNKERQELLENLIITGRVSKGYVITYLKNMIHINGKKKDNELAVMKWRDDLNFVYNL